MLQHVTLDHNLSNHRRSPLGGIAKGGGGGGGGTVMVAGEDGLSFFYFILFFYFKKLNNKRLKIIFELNWYTYYIFLLVEYEVE